MCVDTRVIPIALSEHTHSSHSSHSPTYGVRVCLTFLRVRVRARACVRVSLCMCIHADIRQRLVQSSAYVGVCVCMAGV